MKIRLLGQRNILGIGTHFAGLADALRRFSIFSEWIEEVDITDSTQLGRAAETSSDEDVNIWFWSHPRMLSLRGWRVVWAIFESDWLSPRYVEFVNRTAHVVWVPSEWGRGVLVRSGVSAERIDVIPEGIDASLYHNHIREATVRNDQPFRFLTVGKFEKRKAYPELLQAFGEAFAGDPGVQLILKADHFSDAERKRSDLTRIVAASGLDNVKLLWGGWPKEQLALLYSNCDAFVFPSRAEAWGLPALEAIACGLPIAIVNYAGVTEYVSQITSSAASIDYSLQPIDDPEYFRFWQDLAGSPARWAAPSVASLAESLRSLRSRHGDYLRQARVNSLLVRERFSWTSAAARALQSVVGRQLVRLGSNFSV